MRSLVSCAWITGLNRQLLLTDELSNNPPGTPTVGRNHLAFGVLESIFERVTGPSGGALALWDLVGRLGTVRTALISAGASAFGGSARLWARRRCFST